MPATHMISASFSGLVRVTSILIRSRFTNLSPQGETALASRFDTGQPIRDTDSLKETTMDPRSASFAMHVDAALARSLARPVTVACYHTLLIRANLRLGPLPVRKVSREHVLECLADARAEGLAPKTLANLLQAIRLVLRSAGSAAADGIKISVPDPDVRPLSALEADRLRAVMVEGLLLDDAILALLGSGLRLAELERLRTRDWDGSQARVASQAAGATKSGKARLVDVASWARAAVSRVVENGAPPRRSLRRRLADRCRAAGVPEIRVHDLRHTRITLMLLKNEAPVLYVAAQAGHHDTAYTMRRYGHLAVATPEERARWSD